MLDVIVNDAVDFGLMVEKVKHVLHCEGEGVASLDHAENRFEKIVDVLLNGSLKKERQRHNQDASSGTRFATYFGDEESGQIDLGNHLAPPVPHLDSVVAVRLYLGKFNSSTTSTSA